MCTKVNRRFPIRAGFGFRVAKFLDPFDLFLGQRRENSPHLLGNVQERKSKNKIFRNWIVVPLTVNVPHIPVTRAFFLTQIGAAIHILKETNG
jgi:hypothetical protein